MASQNGNTPIVRFAPSPTGPFHVGSARAALFNYLFVKKMGGTFILRIEDTDKERSKKEYEQNIYDSLAWLGLAYDHTMRQSDRTDVYKTYLKKLVDSGAAFVSKEKKEKEGDREEVIRFKNSGTTVSFTDLIKGPISFDTTELGDFVIAKSMEEPLYHLAVVVDDLEMGITHVIRGEDHISNTPRHILIQRAIGAPQPVYAHLPLILAPDRSKLSKRKHGETVSVSYYMKQGYLPEALVNFLALLGWNPGTDQELFTLPQLIEAFDFSKIQKSGAIFDVSKLDWMNKEYLKKTPAAPSLISDAVARALNLGGNANEEAVLKRAAPAILERINKLADVDAMAATGELQYLFKAPVYAKEALFWKDEKDAVKISRRLAEVKKLLTSVDAPLTAQSVRSAIWDFATKEGRGGVLWPLRVALSGKEHSPDPFTLAEILGKDETLSRIDKALALLEGR